MANKRKYTPKVEGYVPEAIDGDNDGLVQDGTEFERPVGTEIEEAMPTTYLVKTGENVQVVAAKYLPEGMTRNEYARKLFELNGQFSAGQVIRL